MVDAGFREDQVAPIPFGCAPGLFAGPELERDIDVLAAGFDAGRDYETFFAGISRLPVTVDLLCSPRNLEGLQVPSNVRVHGVVPYDRYRHMMRRSKIVAVPTRELAYPTGQSVALDAAAAGAALAVTGTTPLKEYFSEDNAVLISPGDSNGWGEALASLLANRTRREALAAAAGIHVRTNHDYDNMWIAFTRQLRAHGLPAPQSDSPA
nr:glycosyltransferase [Tessaracoccus sp. MC1627]